MDLFFICMREKQRICVDVGQAAKVEAIQKIIQSLLELPEAPKLMKPAALTTTATRKDVSKIKWEPMESNKLLSSYEYTNETALAHEPIPIAFLLPGDKNPVITPLSKPNSNPAETNEDGETDENSSS